MPDSGSQVTLCDMPIRIDSYAGCTHFCAYCFVLRTKSLDKIALKDTPATVRAFVEGRRHGTVAWCDYEQPLHWGGMSDPFQRLAEDHYRNSRDILEVFAETGYPVVFSTKSTLPVDEPYRSLIARSNVIGQVSMLGPSYDRVEPGTPTFAERLAMLPDLAEICRRVVVRAQPFVLGIENEIIEAIPAYAKAGVYGIILEGMKSQRKKPGMVRCGADFVYPVDGLRLAFAKVRAACREHGLVFLVAENRLRLEMSDSVSCCGAGDLFEFGQTNTGNLNHVRADGTIPYTPRQLEPGSGEVFKGMAQTTIAARAARGLSYAQLMDRALRTKGIRETMGLPIDDVLADDSLEV
jgi:DNA repair photolyase